MFTICNRICMFGCLNGECLPAILTLWALEAIALVTPAKSSALRLEMGSPGLTAKLFQAVAIVVDYRPRAKCRMENGAVPFSGTAPLQYPLWLMPSNSVFILPSRPSGVTYPDPW